MIVYKKYKIDLFNYFKNEIKFDLIKIIRKIHNIWSNYGWNNGVIVKYII
jgi:hypothetical protein